MLRAPCSCKYPATTGCFERAHLFLRSPIRSFANKTKGSRGKERYMRVQRVLSDSQRNEYFCIQKKKTLFI